MTTLLEQIVQAVQDIGVARDDAVADEATMHAIIHGPASGTGSTVVTDSGTVDTLAKVLAGLPDAATQGNISTRAAAILTSISTGIKQISLAGRTTVGDSLPSRWTGSASSAGTSDVFQSADGRYWSLQSSDAPLLDVVAFGADPTGATVCYNEINNALTVAAAKGLNVYANGTFDTGSGTIDVPTGVTLIGAGADRTIFKRTVDVASAHLRFNSTNHCGARNLTLQYTPTTWHIDGAHTAIYAINAVDLDLDGITIKGRYYVGSYLSDVTRGSVRNGKVYGVINRSYYVAALSATQDVTHINCLASGYDLISGSRSTDYAYNTNGFGLGTGKNIAFIDCDGYGFVAHGLSFSERMENQVAVGCYMEDIIGGPGFLIQAANGYPSGRTQFIGCQARSCTAGFDVLGSSYAALIGCIAELYVSYGFLVVSTTNSTLVGCIAENGGVGGAIGFSFDGTSGAPSSTLAVVGCAAIVPGAYGFNSTANTSSFAATGNVATGATTADYNWGGSGHKTTGGNIG